MDAIILIGFKYKDDRLLPYTHKDLEKMNDYVKYPWDKTIITDFDFPDTRLYSSIKDFKELIKDKIRDRKRIFLFYTGHALDKDRLLLPDGLTMDNSELLDILSYSDIKSNILTFFDCCYGFNLDLPFYLDNMIDKESNSKNMKCDISKRFLTQTIISVTSSNIDQPGRMTKTGSTFTDMLIGIDLRKITRWDLMGFNLRSSFPDLLFNY